MKLPLNKNNTASAEIRTLLGFTDKDLSFEKLQPTLITAVDDVVAIIGTPTYDIIIGYYEATNPPTDLQLDLVKRLQYAVVLDAYRNFTAENDLAHTPNGRVARVEENQKIAFEWQIERSNRSMERKYYKSLDALIKNLDANLPSWKTSDAYKQTHNLFIRTVDDIQDYFNINDSRLMMIKLASGFRKAEIDEILPRIGSEKFDDLKTKLQSNTAVDSILLKLIKEAIVFKSLSWTIARLSPQLLPEGLFLPADVSRLTTSAKKAHEKTQAEALSQRFKIDAENAFIRLEEYIKKLNAPTATIPDKITPNFNPCDNFVDT